MATDRKYPFWCKCDKADFNEKKIQLQVRQFNILLNVFLYTYRSYIFILQKYKNKARNTNKKKSIAERHNDDQIFTMHTSR